MSSDQLSLLFFFFSIVNLVLNCLRNTATSSSCWFDKGTWDDTGMLHFMLPLISLPFCSMLRTDLKSWCIQTQGRWSGKQHICSYMFKFCRTEHQQIFGSVLYFEWNYIFLFTESIQKLWAVASMFLSSDFRIISLTLFFPFLN